MDGLASRLRLPVSLIPLQNTGFRLYLTGLLVTSIGRGIELTGAVWLASEFSNTPLQLGILGLARAAPAIILSPIAGVVVDRVDQRRLLQLTQTTSMVAALVMGVLVLGGAAELWHLYLQVAVQSAIFAFDAGVRQALFPRLVPHGQLGEAVTLHSSAGRAAKLIGPTLGGIAIVTLGTSSPFLLNAISYIPLILTAGRLGGAPQSAGAGTSFRAELGDGLRYIASAPVLRGLLQLELMNGIFSVSPVMITIVGREVLGVGPEGLGGLLSAPAVGALLGIAVVLAFGQANRQGRFVILASLSNAAVYALLSLPTGYVVAFLVLVALGMADALIGVTRQQVAQGAAPPRMRGRVMSNFGTVTRGASSLAEVQGGALASLVGAPGAVCVGAAALAISAGLTAITSVELWRYERSSPVAHGASQSGPAPRSAAPLDDTSSLTTLE